MIIIPLIQHYVTSSIESILEAHAAIPLDRKIPILSESRSHEILNNLYEFLKNDLRKIASSC